MVAKTIFLYCTIMLIYANLRENGSVGLIFFSPASREAYPVVRKLEKKITVKKSASESSKIREKQMLVPLVT